MACLLHPPMRGFRAFTIRHPRPRQGRYMLRKAASSDDRTPDLAGVSRSGRYPQSYEPTYESSVSHTYDQLMMERYGQDMYKRNERVFRDERQRLWDNIREIAKVRYEHGLMPLWFKPEWLEMTEPPVNEFMRVRVGSKVYWENHQPDPDVNAGSTPEPAGGSGDNGSSNGGSSGGHGGGWWWYWWQGDDPYWPLQGSCGAHAMLWLTWVTAGLWAAWGLLWWAARLDVVALRDGMGSASLLACCAMAMSDMTHGEYSALAVKIAFMLCCGMAWREMCSTWVERGRLGVGLLAGQALLMCLGYLRTDMSGLDDLQVPNLQEATARLKLPMSASGAGAGEKVWVDYLGQKLRAYMQLRTQRIKAAALEPKHPLDLDVLLSYLERGAATRAGAAVTVAN